MAQNNRLVSLAYSDDGRQRSNTEDLSHPRFGRGDLPADQNDNDGVASITANISEHRVRHQERPDEDADAIYEMPDEDEHVSSPPDSLSHQDIMSEHIASKVKIHKFGKVDKPQSVYPDHLSDEISKEVHESQAAAPHMVPPEARVSSRVQLVETSRSIQTYKMTFDRLFKKFHHKLVTEYSNMRGGYMSEYQLNYDQNTSRREDRLVEMNLSIEAQDNYGKDLEKSMEQQESCLNAFFKQKSDMFRIKTVWKGWRFYFGVYKRKARREAYMRNTLYRKKLDRIFSSWRTVSHAEFKTRMIAEKQTFRTDLESKILVVWSTKVDALILYVSQLEDKIKQEQESREQLTSIYDQSLATGYVRLQNETALLSQNPLLHEVTKKQCQGESRVTVSAAQLEMLARIRNQQAEYSKQLETSSQQSSRRSDKEQAQFDRLTQHYLAQVEQDDTFGSAGGQQAYGLHVASEMKLRSNHELTGILNWSDLGDNECSAAYKNDFENSSGVVLTQSGILDLYSNQVYQFQQVNSGRVQSLKLSYQVTEGSLKENELTIYEQLRFSDQAESANSYIQGILAHHKRRQWDRNIQSLRMAGPIIDRNMLIFEEVSHEILPGSPKRSALLKQFLFRAEGCFFVYTSSVQDEVAAEDDLEKEDASRYCLVFQILCFKRDGNDLVMDRIQQIDFKQGSNEILINQFIQSQEVKTRYWKQELTEAVQSDN